MKEAQYSLVFYNVETVRGSLCLSAVVRGDPLLWLEKRIDKIKGLLGGKLAKVIKLDKPSATGKVRGGKMSKVNKKSKKKK